MQRFEKITIIGVGLLGGSLGLAIKQRGLSKVVYGYVRRVSSAERCRELGVVDYATLNIEEAVAGADLIILCTPLAQMRSLYEMMAPYVKSGAIITDVGSAKMKVVKDLEGVVAQRGAYFVGSHPMAGSEKTGVEYSRADLFENAICVVTPTESSADGAVLSVEDFWRAVGGRVLRMTPQLHDELVCRASHLPHIIAAVLANYVLDPAYPQEQAKLCATGFRDTTRIASSSPEMWRDVSIANREHIIKSIDDFIEGLRKFKEALHSNDTVLIEEFFKSAKERRDNWIQNHFSPE